MDENDPLLDDENPYSEANRLLRISEWAKANGLLGPDGEPREILGTLPITKDGVVIGQEASVWFFDDDGIITTALTTAVEADNDDDRYHLFGHDCYSTREAAERAAKERSDGQ